MNGVVVNWFTTGAALPFYLIVYSLEALETDLETLHSEAYERLCFMQVEHTHH
jgi:hypothetical protein